jgi:hypothetical protein
MEYTSRHLSQESWPTLDAREITEAQTGLAGHEWRNGWPVVEGDFYQRNKLRDSLPSRGAREGRSFDSALPLSEKEPSGIHHGFRQGVKAHGSLCTRRVESRGRSGAERLPNVSR